MPEESVETSEAQEDEKLQPLPITPAYANQVTVLGSGTDITIVFSRVHPAVGLDGRLRHKTAIPQYSAVVQMSPQAAKDLSLALADAIEKLERDFGKLVTPYTKKVEASQK
jgi:hypothetical protein